MNQDHESMKFGFLVPLPIALPGRTTGTSAGALSGHPVALAPNRPVGSYERWVKPAMDRLAAAVLLVLLSPVMGVVALLIRLSMGPGVIFTQQRIGRGGVPFTIYKFRSMRHDRRVRQQPFKGPDRRKTHKTKNDPRHTPVGRFIRATSLDELPQLFNVLKGDMSIVGPRPELPQVVEERYEEWAHRRHDVRPGITGLWQVSERDDEGQMHKHVALDLLYVASVSFWVDTLILLLTAPAVLRIRLRFAVVPESTSSKRAPSASPVGLSAVGRLLDQEG